MDRLINWTEVEEWMHRQHETTEQWSMRIAIENYVDAMPEAVVRCKDCSRSSIEYWTRDGLRKTDDKHLFCKMVHHLMRLDDFCSYGERREDGQTD